MINPANLQRILIVDDSMTARMIIKQCLQIIGQHDTEYLEAPDGYKALEILRKYNVDLLVTDLNMPLMDGKTILVEIKSDNLLRNIPVIIITSSNNDSKEQELKQLGAAAIINKPLSPAKLHLALGSVLE